MSTATFVPSFPTRFAVGEDDLRTLAVGGTSKALVAAGLVDPGGAPTEVGEIVAQVQEGDLQLTVTVDNQLGTRSLQVLAAPAGALVHLRDADGAIDGTVDLVPTGLVPLLVADVVWLRPRSAGIAAFEASTDELVHAVATVGSVGSEEMAEALWSCTVTKEGADEVTVRYLQGVGMWSIDPADQGRWCLRPTRTTDAWVHLNGVLAPLLDAR